MHILLWFQLNVTVTYNTVSRLLHVQNSNCKYNDAKATCREAMDIIETLQSQDSGVINKATLYTECCSLLFAESQYDEVSSGHNNPIVL